MTRTVTYLPSLLLLGLLLLVPQVALADTDMFGIDSDYQSIIDSREEIDYDELEDVTDYDDWQDYPMGGKYYPSIDWTDWGSFGVCLTHWAYTFIESAAILINEAILEPIGEIAGYVNFFGISYDGSVSDNELLSGTTVFSTLRSAAVTVQESVVTPVTLGFLGLTMILAMLDFAKGATDHPQGSLNKLAGYLWIVAGFLVVYELIENVDLLCNAILSLFSWMTSQVSSVLSLSSTGGLGSLIVLMQSLPYSMGWFYALVFLILMIPLAWAMCGWVWKVAQYSIARIVEIYVYSAFMGIPLVMLTSKETRDGGIRFIKSFVALCLRGVVFLFCYALAPVIVETTTELACYVVMAFNGLSLTNVGTVAISSVAAIVLGISGETLTAGFFTIAAMVDSGLEVIFSILILIIGPTIGFKIASKLLDNGEEYANKLMGV